MSERRSHDEMTDPGPPPEEALDATLRALGSPVPAQARRTPESAGLDAAHYHAEPHRPAKAHEPPSSSKVSTTEPMAAAQTPLERDAVRVPPREPRPDLTTVPRAAPPPSRMRAFAGALVFVVLVLGIGMWAVTRGGSQVEVPSASGSAAPTPPASATVAAVPVAVAVPPMLAASLVAPGDGSSATGDPSRPTVRSPSTATSGGTAPPRRAPTAATSATPAVSSAPSAPSAPAPATAPVAPPAPTSKYNRFLEEDKK